MELQNEQPGPLTCSYDKGYGNRIIKLPGAYHFKQECRYRNLNQTKKLDRVAWFRLLIKLKGCTANQTND